MPLMIHGVPFHSWIYWLELPDGSVFWGRLEYERLGTIVAIRT